MKIDLCKIFGVDEGEEFKIINSEYEKIKYVIDDGKIYYNSLVGEHYWVESNLELNEISGVKIVKLPKKKQFTDDELCILRSVDKVYKWIVKDDNGDIYVFEGKPKNYYGVWNNDDSTTKKIDVFNHLFNSITWEDEEPVFIDDYVERNN